jgi:outer membrane protein TolC
MVQEANLRAQHANVDAARAAFFPSLSLTASDGSTAGAGLALFNPSTLAWTIGASLAQTIFDSGRLHYASASARANERIQITTYRNTVFQALSDVETQLGQVDSTTLSLGFVTEQVRAQTEAARIAELQVREGVTDLTAPLQAQTNLFNARSTLVTTKLNRLTASVGLFRSLGGGWTVDAADKSEVDAVGWSPL